MRYPDLERMLLKFFLNGEKDWGPGWRNDSETHDYFCIFRGKDSVSHWLKAQNWNLAVPDNMRLAEEDGEILALAIPVLRYDQLQAETAGILGRDSHRIAIHFIREMER